MSSDIIANLQQLKNRWLSVVSTHKIGDQLDGDFDILDEAIAKLRARELSTETPATAHGGSAAAVGGELESMCDAYHGAMEDLNDWKRRAQVAEAELRKFGYKGVTASQSPKPVGYANVAEFNAKNGGFICKRECDPSFFPIPMFARTD